MSHSYWKHSQDKQNDFQESKLMFTKLEQVFLFLYHHPVRFIFQHKFHDWISLKTFQFAVKSVKCRADSQQVLVCLLRLSDKREMLLNKYLLNLQGWFFYFCTKTNENINTISILIIEQDSLSDRNVFYNLSWAVFNYRRQKS